MSMDSNYFSIFETVLSLSLIRKSVIYYSIISINLNPIKIIIILPIIAPTKKNHILSI